MSMGLADQASLGLVPTEKKPSTYGMESRSGWLWIIRTLLSTRQIEIRNSDPFRQVFGRLVMCHSTKAGRDPCISRGVNKEMDVKIFRDALRLSRQLPSQAIRRKFRYNMREAVEYYSNSRDAARVGEIEALAKDALVSLRRLLSAEPSVVSSIFRPLEYANRIENNLKSKKK